MSGPPPDNYVTVVIKGGYVDAPVHQHVFCGVCTKSKYLTHQINAISPPSWNHFLHLHRYIYLRNVEPVFYFLTGTKVSQEHLIFPKTFKWTYSMHVLESISETMRKLHSLRTIGFYMMIDALGIYDDLLWQTVNLAWWLLTQAFHESSQLRRLTLDDWKSETNRVWQNMTADNMWNDGRSVEDSLPCS